jgi:hypothetical protein
MISYSEKEIFTKRDMLLLDLVKELVRSIPSFEDLRCHELARAVGKTLELQVQDGYYGFVDHSWLWTEPFKKEGFWRLSCPRILDVYAVGSLPQVRLLDSSTNLPHVGWAYRPGDPRDDIDEMMVKRLVNEMADTLTAKRIEECRRDGLI